LYQFFYESMLQYLHQSINAGFALAFLSKAKDSYERHCSRAGHLQILKSRKLHDACESRRCNNMIVIISPPSQQTFPVPNASVIMLVIDTSSPLYYAATSMLNPAQS